MKTRNIVLLIFVIIIIIVLFYFGYKYYTNKDTQKVSGGSQPNQADKDCASGGNSSERVIIGNCTKPRIYPVPKPMREKCFTSEELDLNEGDFAPDKVTEANGFGTTWYYNYQSGDRFCYTNPEWYKNQ